MKYRVLAAAAVGTSTVWQLLSFYQSGSVQFQKSLKPQKETSQSSALVGSQTIPTGPENHYSIKTLNNGSDPSTGLDWTAKDAANAEEEVVPTVFHQSPDDQANALGILPPSDAYAGSEVDPSKPTFVLHVGPPKTGTSTLQALLANFGKVLEQDGYYYIGREGGSRAKNSRVYNMLRRHNYRYKNGCEEEWERYSDNLTESICWDKMHQELEGYRRANLSLILSEETMSWDIKFRKAYHRDSFWKALKNLLQGWNVIVVITYRRHAEWVVSGLKHKYSEGCLGSGFSKRYNWQTEGCEEPWAKIKSSHQNNSTGTLKIKYTDELVPFWQSQGLGPTRILNLHRNMSNSFFCDILPKAPHTCQHSQQQQGTVVKNALSIDKTFYDRIAMTATKQHSWVNTTAITRKEFVQELINYHQTKLGLDVSRLPLVCPSDAELEEYLEVGLAVEHKLLGPNEKPNELRSAFWKLAHGQKAFCHTDTERLFDQCSSWEDLKERLKRTTW